MRQRWISIVLGVTAALLAPRTAAAFCEAPGPYLGISGQLPLGCPVHVYFSLFGAPGLPDGPGGPPRITVLRDGVYLDVTGLRSQEPVNLRMDETILDCQFRVVNMSTTFQPFELMTFHPESIAIGERIGVGNGWLTGIEIVPAAACAAPIEPTIQCTTAPGCGGGFPPPFEEFESQGGCAAGGGGLAIGLALLGLLRRRR